MRQGGLSNRRGTTVSRGRFGAILGLVDSEGFRNWGKKGKEIN